MVLTYIIVTYAYICFSNLSTMVYTTASLMLECSPTDITIASLRWYTWCPFIIDARPARPV